MNDARFALRNVSSLFKRNRPFALLLVLGVGLVLFCQGVVGQAAKAAEHRVLESSIMRTVEVDSAAVGTPIELTNDRIAAISQQAGVKAVRPWLQAGCLIVKSGVPVSSSPWATPRMPVGQPPVVRGEKSADLRDAEVVLPSHVQGVNLDILVNKMVTLEYTNRVTADSGEPLYMQLRVVGLYDESFGSRDGPSAIYLSQKTVLKMAAAHEGLRPEQFGQVKGFRKLIVETVSADDVPRLQRDLTAMGFNASSVQSELDALPPAVSMISLLGRALTVGLLIISLGAGLTISAGLVRGRMREIGILKAIGFSNLRVAKVFGIELAVFGVVPSAAGLVIGFASILGVQELSGGSLLGIQLSDKLALPALGWAAAVILGPPVAMLLGAGLPLFRAATLPPDIALRDRV
jgi:putative ABC transport system permease protein